MVTSQWLKAISAYLTKAQLQVLASDNSIKYITPVAGYTIPSAIGNIDTLKISTSISQINGAALHKAGYSGKGIKIGIIDGGFHRSNKEKGLASIIMDERVLGYRNFIEKHLSDPYIDSRKSNAYHGTRVWLSIAGRHGKLMTGLAPDASFYLARTDQSDREYRGEEDNWVAALEWMYDEGVRLVNSSLGYSDGYDLLEEDYSPVDVDGRSSAITQAAQIAAEEKGMLIVISAGNDGNKKFKVISIPSDAKGVLTVGATDHPYWTKAPYSSVGPGALSYVKPDVACFSRDGTSFSAPVITGLAACIMEANRDLSNKEIKNMILASSHLHARPNNFLGHGVPDARKIVRALHQADVEHTTVTRIKSNHNTVIIPSRQGNMVAFHTLDKRNILGQERLTFRREGCHVSRKKNAIFTIVASKTHIWEIEWKLP